MKRPRFQFGLRFFLVAVVVSAFALIFIWEQANQPLVFRSKSRILGAVTSGDINSLEELTISPAEAMRSITRDRDLRKLVSSDMLWQCVEIEPMETIRKPPRNYPLIGEAFIRSRDFRCKLEGVDPNSGKTKNAVVIVNRNHFHAASAD
jgi:hypothetical protein